MSQCQWKYTSVIENHNNVLRVIKFKCLLEIFKVPKGLLKLSTKWMLHPYINDFTEIALADSINKIDFWLPQGLIT